MVQAARSGKQNIVEGSQASGTSKEMEIKLTGVARASLEELLQDYYDFLRVRDHDVWEKDSREACYVANYLLDKQIKRLEKDFLKEGGLRERMTRARLQAREKNTK